jgi:tetratricopeptide (TPR) repeat protein
MLAIAEKALGSDHPDAAASLRALAEPYRQQGRYAEAEPLLRSALAIEEKALGPNHPAVATSLSALASLYREQARYDEAEPLFRRAIGIQEKALGPDHYDLGASLNRLAVLYQAQGRYSEAEPLFKRALAIVEKAFGPDHPDIATSLNHLAALYRVRGDWAHGRYGEAEPLLKRALTIEEKALGPDHPEVATSLAILALLYEAQNRTDDAFAASARAVDILQKHLAAGTTQRSGGGIAEQRSDRPFFVNYVRIAYAVARSRPEQKASTAAETFRIAQFAQSSAAAQAVAGMAARFTAGSDALATAVRERQDLVGRWQQLDADIVKAASRPMAERKRAEEVARRGALEETARQLDALDARIAREFQGMLSSATRSRL